VFFENGPTNSDTADPGFLDIPVTLEVTILFSLPAHT